MDYLDLYYIHRVDPTIPIEETAGVMKELIDQGKITHWGISEATEKIIRRAHKVCPLTAVQNRYSMMYRNYESLFPVLKELQIGTEQYGWLINEVLQLQKNAVAAAFCTQEEKEKLYAYIDVFQKKLSAF